MDALLLLKISHNGIFHCQHYRRCPPSFSNQEERNDTPFYDFIPGLNGKFFVALFFVYSAVNFEVALPLFQICKRTGLFPAFTLSWIYSVSGISLGISLLPGPKPPPPMPPMSIEPMDARSRPLASMRAAFSACCPSWVAGMLPSSWPWMLSARRVQNSTKVSTPVSNSSVVQNLVGSFST